MDNKKVLLRERKRHTARCVANTPYVVLTGYPPGGGTRSGTPPGGSGYPPGGVPGQVPGGVWVPPPGGGTRSGTPGGSGYSPGGGTQTPPPPPVDRQTPVKTVPSRRTTYAGGNNFSGVCLHVGLSVCLSVSLPIQAISYEPQELRTSL